MRWVLPLVALIAVVTNTIVLLSTAPEVPLGPLIGQIIGNTVTALLVAFATITIVLALGDRGRSDSAGEKTTGTSKA